MNQKCKNTKLISFDIFSHFIKTSRTQRYAHWYDAQYHSTYIPFYGNAHSFIFGMIGGLVYSKHKQGHFDLTKTKVCKLKIEFSLRKNCELLTILPCGLRWFKST